MVIHRLVIGIEDLKDRCHRTKHSPFVRDHRKSTVLVRILNRIGNRFQWKRMNCTGIVKYLHLISPVFIVVRATHICVEWNTLQCCGVRVILIPESIILVICRCESSQDTDPIKFGNRSRI